MKNIFSQDSTFTRIMGRIGSIVVLNVLFILTSIPVITIGASATALYKVCFEIGTDSENSVIKSYWKAFGSNFRQATVLWLLFLVCGASAILYIFMTSGLQSAMRYIAIPFGILLLLFMMCASYAFPLLSQYNNTTKNTLRNAVILCLGYLPKSLLITLIHVIPIIVWLFATHFFMHFVWIWIFFYFSGAGYVNSRLLEKVFYRDSTADGEDENSVEEQ